MTERGSRRRLGRGLEALLGSLGEEGSRDEHLNDVPVDAVSPNPFQPRRHFDEAQLAELAESIRASGLLQPIVVRPADPDHYELIAGERRLRAVQRLGWHTIPAVIREADDATLLTLALVENLQRDSLSPIEEAQGYHRLLTEFHLSQQQVAGAVGRDRSTVANAVRLLRLPAAVQSLVHDRALSVGHARALAAIEDADFVTRLAEEAVARAWSVREMETHTRRGRPRARRPRLVKSSAGQAAEQRRVEDALRRRLQTDVHLVVSGERGRIEIAFYSNDDLGRLLDLILREPFS